MPGGTSPKGATSRLGSSQIEEFWVWTITPKCLNSNGVGRYSCSQGPKNTGQAKTPAAREMEAKRTYLSSGVAYSDERMAAAERGTNPVEPSARSTVVILCETKS